MVSYPNALEDNVFDDLFIGESEVRDYYLNVFKHAFGNNHTWDYQWTYSKIINNSINIILSTKLGKKYWSWCRRGYSHNRAQLKILQYANK